MRGSPLVIPQKRLVRPATVVVSTNASAPWTASELFFVELGHRTPRHAASARSFEPVLALAALDVAFSVLGLVA
jgi:hypothetical protein